MKKPNMALHKPPQLSRDVLAHAPRHRRSSLISNVRQNQTMKIHIILLLAILTCAASARSPEDTIRGMFASLSEAGLPGALDYVHDTDLPEYRKYIANVTTKAREQADRDPRMKELVDGLSPDFEKLPTRDYVKAGLTAMGGAKPETVKAFRGLSIQTLGHVVEGNLAHVVVRMRIPLANGAKQEIKVFTVKEQAGKYWYTRSGGGTFMTQLFEK